MPCELKKENLKYLGMTLFSKDGSRCQKKPTAVYVAPKHLDTDNTLNVVLWLHGYYVEGHKQLFHGNQARVRETVLKSSKDVILIAPWLGDKEKAGDGVNLSKDVGTEKWGERYLDEVLNALAPHQNWSSAFNIENLVIACHSGGGAVMRNLVGTLGKYEPKLKECWGFDCLYGPTKGKNGPPELGKPDDTANFWYDWMRGDNARPLYIFYGPSTLPQSVKLQLMGLGKADRKGNKADPPGDRIKDLHVIHSHYEDYTKNLTAVDEAFDRILSKPSPTPPQRSGGKPVKAEDGDFVKQAVDKMTATYAFPDGVHYHIAQQFFLSQLGNAAFL